jgi:hypothetical protein
MAVVKQEKQENLKIKQNIENPNPLGKSDDRMKPQHNSILTKDKKTNMQKDKYAKRQICKKTNMQKDKM